MTVAADTASDLAQLCQIGSHWEALQAAAHQMGSAAMGIAAEHTLQPAQGVRPRCEGQCRGLEGGKTGGEQGLPVDGRKMAERFGEQGARGGMKGGSGGPAYEAVRDRRECDLAELAQRIETDSCNYIRTPVFPVEKRLDGMTKLSFNERVLLQHFFGENDYKEGKLCRFFNGLTFCRDFK